MLDATKLIPEEVLKPIPVGRLVLTPVRRAMRRFAPVSQRPMLGRYGTVRSPELTPDSGTAEVDDGGAGLILDYGYGEAAGFSETLQAVSGHRFAEALYDPGHDDISAHVDFAAFVSEVASRYAQRIVMELVRSEAPLLAGP